MRVMEITVFIGKTRFTVSEKCPKDLLIVEVVRENSDGIKSMFVPRELFDEYARRKVTAALEAETQRRIDELMGGTL